MTWTLYHAPLACSLACRLTLTELSITHDLVILNLAAGDTHTADFLRLNLHGRVPALATGGGVLSENLAILSYLADFAGEHRLLPTDPWARAAAMSWLGWMSNTLHPAYTRALRPEQFTDAPDGTAGIRSSAVTTLVAALTSVDQRLAEREYLLDNLSVCDLYLLVFALWRRSLVLADRLPGFAHLDAWQARLLTRPSLAACVADDLRLFAAQSREHAS